MQIQQNYSLKKYNTFGIDVDAKCFSAFSSVDDLQEALSPSGRNLSGPYRVPILILGGGSNILFTKN